VNHATLNSNLISYFPYNEKGGLISHGLGVALDIRKGGIFWGAVITISASNHKVAMLINFERYLWITATATILQFHGAPNYLVVLSTK
jgi:hypothetical protein